MKNYGEMRRGRMRRKKKEGGRERKRKKKRYIERKAREYCSPFTNICELESALTVALAHAPDGLVDLVLDPGSRGSCALVLNIIF